MNTYKGPYQLSIEGIIEGCTIMVDNDISILKALSSKRALYSVLRFARSIITDSNGKEVNIQEPFIADGQKYDLTQGKKTCN
jgi:hypothetical protein